MKWPWSPKMVDADVPCTKVETGEVVVIDPSADIKKENERIRAEVVKAKMAKYIAEDELDKVQALTHTPIVNIISHSIGDFIEYEGESFPKRFIESIKITSEGKPPHMEYEFGCNGFPAPAYQAAIEITMCSGQKHRLYCSRHNVLFVHEALVTCWKN